MKVDVIRPPTLVAIGTLAPNSGFLYLGVPYVLCDIASALELKTGSGPRLRAAFNLSTQIVCVLHDSTMVFPCEYKVTATPCSART